MPGALPTISGRGAERAGELELQTEHRDALRLLGYYLLRQNRAADAVAVFRGLHATDRGDHHAHRSLIYAHLANDEAERALDVAGSYVPQPDEPLAAAIHLLRAQALWRLGRPQEAREDLDRFIKLREVR